MAHIQVRRIKDLAPHRSKIEPLPSARFVKLPEELVAMIMMNLDLKSLIRVRTTCTVLNRISRARQIWRNLFLSNLGVTIPRPFFLSKALQLSSASDIETDLRRWETGWGSRYRKPTILERQVQDLEDVKWPPAEPSTLSLLPGGRWFISAHEDGSVSYCDVLHNNSTTGNLSRKLLIPSPFEGTKFDGLRIHTRISIDFSSREAAGNSLESYHLQQFSVAVAACPKDFATASTHVNIWRVHVPKDGDVEGQLRLGDCLSAFTEIGTSSLEDCSLLGPTVAYSLGGSPARCVVIVSWPESNGKLKETLERRYLPTLALDKIILLPGKRLFAIHQRRTVLVYDWEKVSLASTAQPHEQQFSRAQDSWQASFPLQNTFGISTAMTINGTTRVAINCPQHVCGFNIPIEGEAQGTSSTFLKMGSFGYNLVQAYGYHRGIGLKDFGTLVSSEYRWPDETLNPGTRSVISCYHKLDPWKDYDGGRLLFDQYSNRTVATDFYGSRLFFISFTE